MTKRKPRRKTPKKIERPVGWIWWTTGLLSLGWLIFDANRATVLSYVPDLAWATQEPQSRAASAEASPSPIVQARPLPAPPRSTVSEGDVAKAVAVPARIAHSNVPGRALVMPTRRPSAEDAPAANGAVTGRRTPLYREPSSEAPVWVLLEAGRPLRVTGRKGSWRHVETGIFTGWIDADAVATRAPSAARPTRSAMARGEESRPVPPGAIPDVRH